MSFLALSFTLVFILIAILLSMWRKLDLEKDILVGTVRSAVQLLLVGYVLQFVFHSNNPLYIVLIILVMTAVAAWNSSRRGKGFKGVAWRAALTLLITEGVTMAVLVGLNIIQPTPQYLIPVSGMIIGNAMVVCSLFLNHMNREVESSKGEIEMMLALGATIRQAVQGALKRSVKSSMIPTIDSLKTVGLVQLPGMMTGMIVAGANPVEAVRYQILILFAITSSAAITSILISVLSYKLWFTPDERLKA